MMGRADSGGTPMTDGRTVADGRYVLGALLGRGGMAQVHQGLDLRLDRPVAVKQLSAHLAADPTAQARFRREAQAAASLNHPAIASVFDTGEETDPVTGTVTPYIVMELVEGSTLRQVLNDSGPLPPARALLVAQGVLDALGHSHAAGIIHRDIKPANVMLTAAGAVKVMDFGIARAMDDTSMSLTQTATVIGTAQYLSPEQAAGQSVDLRSDLYSVGCLLFELLVGRPPFVGRELDQHRLPAGPRGPRAAEPARPDAAAGGRRGRAQGAGQGPRPALPERAGDEGRPRPAAARPRHLGGPAGSGARGRPGRRTRRRQRHDDVRGRGPAPGRRGPDEPGRRRGRAGGGASPLTGGPCAGHRPLGLPAAGSGRLRSLPGLRSLRSEHGGGPGPGRGRQDAGRGRHPAAGRRPRAAVHRRQRQGRHDRRHRGRAGPGGGGQAGRGHRRHAPDQRRPGQGDHPRRPGRPDPGRGQEAVEGGWLQPRPGGGGARPVRRRGGGHRALRRPRRGPVGRQERDHRAPLRERLDRDGAGRRSRRARPAARALRSLPGPPRPRRRRRRPRQRRPRPRRPGPPPGRRPRRPRPASPR